MNQHYRGIIISDLLTNQYKMSFNLLLALISNVYCRWSKKYNSSLSNTARIIQVNARLTLFMSKVWEKNNVHGLSFLYHFKIWSIFERQQIIDLYLSS